MASISGIDGNNNYKCMWYMCLIGLYIIRHIYSVENSYPTKLMLNSHLLLCIKVRIITIIVLLRILIPMFA